MALAKIDTTHPEWALHVVLKDVLGEANPQRARDVLAALEAAGMQLVPIKITDAIARAYAEKGFWDNWTDPIEHTPAEAVWSAMLTASKR